MLKGSSTISNVFVRNEGDPISWILSIGRGISGDDAIDDDEESKDSFGFTFVEPKKITSSSSLIVFIDDGLSISGADNSGRLNGD
ncbi:hypothetical protein Sjap_002404 [Stephania japonica]|uniref:Uncharacterized protein n=1 Tax=Stephania japonica TaxID=461633 RepID=A0AAP0KNL5_9MAGN